MKFLVFFISVTFFTSTAMAEFSTWSSRQGPSSLREKSENNYRDYWTLSDWFETQRKNRLMDQWLAMNSSSNPFEFSVGFQTSSTDSVTTTNGVPGLTQEYRINKIQGSAYASIIGIEAEHADSKEDYEYTEGSLNLRLLGKNSQGTNLTGFYGLRYKKDNSLAGTKEEFQQSFAGGSFTLNIIQYFGVIATYKEFFKDKTDLGSELEGSRIEGTAFIDFNFVRVYGTWFKEKEDYTNIQIPVTKTIERDGIFSGIKIFF